MLEISVCEGSMPELRLDIELLRTRWVKEKVGKRSMEDFNVLFLKLLSSADDRPHIAQGYCNVSGFEGQK